MSISPVLRRTQSSAGLSVSCGQKLAGSACEDALPLGDCIFRAPFCYRFPGGAALLLQGVIYGQPSCRREWRFAARAALWFLCGGYLLKRLFGLFACPPLVFEQAFASAIRAVHPLVCVRPLMSFSGHARGLRRCVHRLQQGAHAMPEVWHGSQLPGGYCAALPTTCYAPSRSPAC